VVDRLTVRDACTRFGGATVPTTAGADDERAFEEVVLHLVLLSRIRVATIAGPADDPRAALLLAGYHGLLERMHVHPRREYAPAGGWGVEDGYEAMRVLLALRERPDAVACASDLAALGALRAVEEAGLSCPGDVAVTGFGDAEFGRSLVPALTTVRQPLRNGVPWIELVVRDSCGAIAPAPAAARAA
jgi:LacI family repressor for deo operon, udp, cdd, tsx, nupC, and nupG